jgi:hypothetical protein
VYWLQRSDFVMKVMSAVLFLAIAAYIGLYIYNTANKKLVTTPAVRYTEMDAGYAEGYIIRSETLLGGADGAMTLLAGEGEKVAAGQAVAIYYDGETAMERASEIRALQIEIAEAESKLNNPATPKVLDTNDTILALSNAVRHRDFSDLPDLEYSIRYRVLAEMSEALTVDDVAVLKSRLAQMLGENPGTKTVYTPMSGVFSTVVDGFENCGPEILSDLTPSALASYFQNAQPSDGALGKLIPDITWYFAAVMDVDDAAKLGGSPSATLQFTKTYNKKMSMKVESIGAEENGKCVVVFSSRRAMSDITALRTLTAQVEFNALSGLLVPKEAVYTEPGGKTYIYLLTVLQAEKVYVEILSQTGDHYIVRDGAENGTALREGKEIIVKGEDLYDGKVVER